MDDLYDIYRKVEEFDQELKELNRGFLGQLHAILYGPTPETEKLVSSEPKPAASPQQSKKRMKRLLTLQEEDIEGGVADVQQKITNLELNGDEREEASQKLPVAAPRSAVNSLITHVESVYDGIEQSIIMESPHILMPPPALPIIKSESESGYSRPQRAAKLKTEKNLKEPKLNSKLRRPSNLNDTTIKLEHEQRPSQANLSVTRTQSTTMQNTSNNDSVVILPSAKNSIIDIQSEDEVETRNEGSVASTEKRCDTVKQARVLVKREKLSSTSVPEVPTDTTTLSQTVAGSAELPSKAVSNMSDSTTVTSSMLSATTSTDELAKKSRKKKPVPRPIKVERLSDNSSYPSPIASRTRKGNCERIKDQTQTRPGSVYEDAIDHLASEAEAMHVNTKPKSTAKPKTPVELSKTVVVTGNETIVLGPAPSDATFCVNGEQIPNQDGTVAANATFVTGINSNATMILGTNSNADATFDMPGDRNNEDDSLSTTKQSMQTARDTLQPDDNTELTEEEFVAQMPRAAVLPTSAKAYKMPTRTKELFNPLVQSPVKKKVEAFEKAAATKGGRVLRQVKENAAPAAKGSSITPVIGKIPAASLGRFLTPTQASNVSQIIPTKKAPNSASKALPVPQTVTNLKSTNSSSTKTLSRENSADDFRKGLQKMAEERKKQREQKHIQAAQQREAKERERVERMAKLAKAREEKRLKKQMEEEQKKRALEEINRNIRLQEEAEYEAAKQKAAKAKADEERELLNQIKQQKANARMPPPQSKMVSSKYTFEMLHEDDSTDDEAKTSYKRPPVPTWSRSHIRGLAILRQQYWPSEVIDNFFSVRPTTPDLKKIFPDIDARHLKRNSSVFWSTPPRYSELPKY